MPSAITIQNAPRDVDSLAKVGRFNLRSLADQIVKAGIPIYADDKSKGEFSAGSNAEQAQVLAAALQQLDGGGAPAPTNGKPIRTPSSKGRKSKSSAAAAAPAPAAPSGGAEALLAAVNKQAENISELKEAVEAISEQVTELELLVKGGNRLVAIATACSLTLAEEVCQAPKEDVLRSAVEDTSTLETLMGELNIDEEEEEGNE